MAIAVLGAYNAAEPQTVFLGVSEFSNLGADTVAAMYGTTISAHRQLEIRQRLKQCIEALIEEGFVQPVAGSFRVATVDIDGGKSDVVITEELGATAPNEANVSVAYGNGFDNSPASSLNLKVTAELVANTLLKRRLSAA